MLQLPGLVGGQSPAAQPTAMPDMGMVYSWAAIGTFAALYCFPAPQSICLCDHRRKWNLPRPIEAI